MLKEASEPLLPLDVAELTGSKRENVKSFSVRLPKRERRKALGRAKVMSTRPAQTSYPPVPTVTSYQGW